MNSSDNEKLIEYIITRIERMDNKIDELLRFKWQIIGGSVLFSVFITLIIQVLTIYGGKHG